MGGSRVWLRRTLSSPSPPRTLRAWTKRYLGSAYILYESGSDSCRQCKSRSREKIRVSDPDSFFTDPDPGFFSQSGSGFRVRIQATKNKFFKGKNKILGKFLFSTQKVGILFLFSTNQVPRFFIKQRTFVWYHF